MHLVPISRADRSGHGSVRTICTIRFGRFYAAVWTNFLVMTWVMGTYYIENDMLQISLLFSFALATVCEPVFTRDRQGAFSLPPYAY